MAKLAEDFERGPSVFDDKPWEKCPDEVEPVKTEGDREPDYEELLSPYVKLGRQIQFLVKENRRLKNELLKANGLPPQYSEDSP